MSFSLKLSIIIILSLCFTGCSVKPAFLKGDDKELKALIKAYKEANLQLQKNKKEKLRKNVKKLIVERTPDGYVVSVDLDQASILDVIKQIIHEADKPFLFDSVDISNNISASFEKLPFLNALNLLLETSLLTAKLQNKIVIISNKIDETLPPNAPIQSEVRVRRLDMKTVSTLLDGLYPANPQTNLRVMHFSTVSNTNTVYLNGPKIEVSKAIKLLKKADRQIKHIMIEVVLVEYDSTDLQKLDANVKDYANNQLSNVNLNFGSFASENVEFTSISGANNPRQFTALLDVLVSEEKARLISRPFISTLSGEQAKVHIANDRYVITETAQSGATITAPIPITSGIIMQITPTLFGNDEIHMDIYVEDSQFTESAANVSVEVDKNSATTVMQVADGQTIIIGGLVLNRKSWKNAGFPLMRYVPMLNILFAKQTSEEVNNEVVMYITPHIIDETMTLPFLNQDSFSIEKSEKKHKVNKVKKIMQKVFK